MLLTYTSDGWKAGEESYSGDVQKYLANAYYEIKEDIELRDFNGIGTDGSGQGMSFTGVITGRRNEDGTVPTVTLSGGSTAFVKYSYGSVVRDLKIILDQNPVIYREIWNRGKAEQAPKTFFGGVIGCVLGGDNMIENVTVIQGNNLKVEPTGTKPYLVPVGGYIGVIAGGGVIFRGSYSNNTGITGTGAQLYCNPIIGRVLGGYAFYEGEGEAPDNSDKNYKINKITHSDTYDLNRNESTLTVNSAQGLLILSAIVSSGAGSTASNAYAKGKARNAVYDRIGAEAEPADYAAAIVNAEGKSEPTVSTFNIEQGCGPDLPVLVLEDSDASIIEDYLNVITNGGYEVSGVNLKDPVVYYYDQETDSFAAATSEQLKKEPGSIYLSSGVPRVRNRQYDNGRNRFTLLEADFTVNVNGTSRIYTVSIPVIVKRELQYNFISTFSYGAEFSASTYDGLKTHILESTDNPITAYLTYQYNREKTEYVEYDWQGYMDGGGNMMGVDKVLSFSSGLPSGTQLLLVDCQDGNRAFKYVTKGASSGTKTEIRLSDFTSVTDDTFGFRSSMADILGVTVSQNNTSGKYVEETNVSKAMVRRNNVYYRLVGETETVPEGTNRYDLTVPDLEKQPSPPAENYYLVVNVPSQSDPDFYLNGALSSSLNWEMPSKGTWVHRYDNTSICTGNNDESTYQISSGYSQILTSDSVVEAIDLSGGSRTMKVQFRDKITFSNRQVYGENDQLFLKFTVGLQEHTVQEGTSKIVQGLGFPAGTSGKVHFFVQDDEGNYYTYNGNSWVKKGDTEAEAVSYTWVSQGDEMELILSEDGEHALDLSGVRTMIKGQKGDEESKILIRTEMDVVFSGQETVMEVVPPSENAGIDRWVQMHYTGRLSTQESSLSYSTVTSSVDDRAKYYRGVQYAAILSMDARNISQLGINPLELVPEYLSFGQKSSRIDIMASLSLSKLASPENIKELLKNTKSIDLTLSLQKGGRGEYSETLTNAADYITFDTGISWSIQQSKYYDSTSDRLITSDSFDGTEFSIPITAYVNVKQKDYANYRIKLEVTFNGTSNKPVSVTDTDAYLVYTYACIKPEFFDPSNQ